MIKKIAGNEIFDVVSVEPDKIWAEKLNKKIIIAKKTDHLEYNRTKKLEKWLSQDRNGILYWGKDNYKIQASKIVSWDNNKKILRLEYCRGKNLENLLKENFGTNRSAYVKLIKIFLKWMTWNGLYWKGLAPRHIIINKKPRKIFIIDFERELKIYNYHLSSSNLRNMIRGYVYEEFSSFLFESERDDIFGDIWSVKRHGLILKKSISSSRQRALIEKFFGAKISRISDDQLIFVEKLMSSAVTPFLVNNRPFFPLILLENIKGLKKYVKAISAFKNAKSKADWKNILENWAANSSL